MRNQFLVSSLLLGAAVAAQGQTSSASALPAPAPVSQVFYTHWPEQFVQWVGTELPYSMIELYVDPKAGPEPLFDVVLTERATWKRVHYSNQQSMVDFSKRFGGEAYLTKIKFDRPAQAAPDASYVLRFLDQKGTPILWQFVQGTDVSERGGGLSPAGVQPPVLMYRERSATAGQGTALKIGDVVSAADVWKEIAQPPYFVPYHGAFTENLEVATFIDFAPQWTVDQSPASLTTGAEWKFKSPDGRTLTLTVTTLQGDSATLEQSTPYQQSKITLDARLVKGAWAVRKVHFAPLEASSSKGLTINFPDASGSGDQVKFEVQNGKTRVAAGVQSHAGWSFRDPEWLRSKPKQAQNREPQPATAGVNGNN